MKIEDLPNKAREILKKIYRKDKAFLVFLSGDLGAGKTSLTQFIAKEMGIDEDVTSPTFVILKRYEIPAGTFKNLIHIDSYRLKGYAELQKISFDKYAENPENLILIEWPEMVEGENLKPDIWIRIEHGEAQGERVVNVE